MCMCWGRKVTVYIGVNISSFLPLQNRMCHSSIFGPYNVHNPGLHKHVKVLPNIHLYLMVKNIHLSNVANISCCLNLSYLLVGILDNYMGSFYDGLPVL